MKNIICCLLVFGIIFGICGNASAYKSLGEGMCECDSCSDCSSALNDNVNCSNEVRLNTTIYPPKYSNCIYDPGNFNNKTFNCQGYIISGSTDSIFGIYLSEKSNNTIKNCPIFSFFFGIYLSSSSNNNILTNNTANNNGHGIYLSGCSNNTLTNNTANSNGYGIFLESSSNNTLLHNTANNNLEGINLYNSSNNTIMNNTVNSNNYYGILLGLSSNNTIINNILENFYRDFYIYGSFNTGCDNIVENNTGAENKKILYFNHSVSLSNETLSELILCNADNSYINNVTIEGSDTLKNNGIFAVLTDNSNFTNINSSNNHCGIYLDYSSNNTIRNITANFNYCGIYLDYSSNNTITNITANFNHYGVYLDSESDLNEILYNNITENDNIGVYFGPNSNDNIILHNFICSNDLDIENDGLNSGDNNTCNATSEYTDTNPGEYPCSNACSTQPVPACGCFNGTYNYTCGDTIITDCVMNCNLNSIDTCFTIEDDDVTIDGNGFSIIGNNEGYGINITGRNNITIKNFNIRNFENGIYLWNSSNDTIINNMANSNNESGISIWYSSDNNLNNNAVSLNGYGIAAWGSSNITLNNNNVSLNLYGIVMYSSSNNNLTNNTANSNKKGGIYLWYSSNNTLNNNTISLNNYSGIHLLHSTNNNLTNNTANSNKNGIYIFYSSNFNKILNNTILNNIETGIAITDCDPFGCPGGNTNNIIENNGILNNRIGIYSQNSNSIIRNNYVCSNTELDFNSSGWLSSSGYNNTCDNPDGWGDTTIMYGCTHSCHCNAFDFDNNKERDIFDAVAALEYLSGQRNGSEIFNKGCSYNGSLRLEDVLNLMQKIINGTP